MSHDIYYDSKSGEYAVFTAGELPWHHLGQNVSECQTWAEAIKLAHLDWPVEKLPLYDRHGHPVQAYGTFRMDTGQFLAPVGELYTPVQNIRAFEFVDAVIGNHGAHYESAGALAGGRRIWCLARINDGRGEVVPGDPHEAYLLFSSSHDGSLTTSCRVVNVRVVCANTLATALKQRTTAISIKHTPSGERKLREAERLLATALQGIQDVRQKLRILAERNLTRESFEEALNRLFPKKAEEETVRRKNILQEIIQLYELNDGNRGVSSIKGTAYNLFNAVTQWVDHSRSGKVTKNSSGLSQDAVRAQSAMFGSGSILKEQALEVILEATANNPTRSYQTIYTPTSPTVGGILDAVIDETQSSR